MSYDLYQMESTSWEDSFESPPGSPQIPTPPQPTPPMSPKKVQPVSNLPKLTPEQVEKATEALRKYLFDVSNYVLTQQNCGFPGNLTDDQLEQTLLCMHQHFFRLASQKTRYFANWSTMVLLDQCFDVVYNYFKACCQEKHYRTFLTFPDNSYNPNHSTNWQ